MTNDEALNRVFTTSRIRKDSAGTMTLPVPMGIENKIHLEQGLEVEWQIDGDRLILTPKPPQRFNLEDLCSQITPENKHDYISTGSPMGNETW